MTRGPEIVPLRVYLDMLSRLPAHAFPDYVRAVLADPDVASGIALGDAVAATNAIAAVVYRLYGDAPPDRVATTLRYFGVRVHRKV